MTNASADSSTESSQPSNIGNLPKLAEEIALNQNKNLKSSYESALERLDKKDKTTSSVLNSLIEQNKSKKNLEEQVLKIEKQAQETVKTVGEDIQTLVDALNKTVEALNKQINPEPKNNTEKDAKQKEAAKLTEYDIQKSSIERKYGGYKKDSGLLGTLFPNAYKNFLEKLQNQEIEKLKKTYPEEAKNEIENKKEDKVDSVSATVVKPESNIKGTAKPPEVPTEQEPEENIEAKLSGGEKSIEKTEKNSEPLKIEIVDINDKVLDKLKKLLGKNTAKEEIPEEEDKGIVGDLVEGYLNRRSRGRSGRGSRRPSSKSTSTTRTTGPVSVSKTPSPPVVAPKTGPVTTPPPAVAPKAAPTKTVAEATTKVGEKVGEKAGEKAVAKTAGKTAGKTILKKIPIVGLVAGGYFAVERAIQGDFGGAGLELASGAVSLLPGAGTAASLAIDAGLAGRDIYKATNKDAPATPENTPVSARPALPPTTPPENEITAAAAMSETNTDVSSPEIKLPAQIVPIAAPPITSIATTPVAATQNKETETYMSEAMLSKFDKLIEMLSKNNLAEPATNNNVANSNANTSVVNNLQLGGNEDSITSSRLKTYHYMMDRHRLA